MKHQPPPRPRDDDDSFERIGFNRDFVAEVQRKRRAAEARRVKAEHIGFPHGHDILREATDWRIREDVQARLDERPIVDNRDLTGRVLGDPLPERSALARRRGG